MKLSEMTVKDVKNAILIITPEICEIFKDEEFLEISKNKAKNEDKAFLVGVNMFEKYVNILFDKHYSKIIKILSVLYATSEENIESKHIDEIYNMIVESLSDKVLVRFFPQCANLELIPLSD